MKRYFEISEWLLEDFSKIERASFYESSLEETNSQFIISTYDALLTSIRKDTSSSPSSASIISKTSDRLDREYQLIVQPSKNSLPIPLIRKLS